ncbi:ribonuclease H-like domain-containing protein [Melanogaster broomeanus]|nr:ribonuclease H-like domain-containing protein [Melanogaster broomeanus]
MAAIGGRPVASFVDANFTRCDKVLNKSGRYYWKCNFCGNEDGSKGASIQGRDNSLPKHIIDCAAAPSEIRQEARTFIMGKTRLLTQSSVTTDVTTSEAIAPIRKRKKETLDGFVDYPLTKEQTEEANSRLLQWFIHANIPFLAVNDDFFHYFLNAIRPSYESPSRYVLSHNLLDSEAVRVQQEDIDRLKPRKKLTLLLDGWEDLLKRSLYGSVAVEVNHHPVVLALQDMTGSRGTAENLVTISQKAMTKMEIGDGKNLIAVTTDNPTVMQAFRRKLHLNTLIGDIVAYPEMKKIITKTTRVVSFFNSSHYWGGQLNNEAKKLDIKQRLKQNCESRFYALILHCMSVKSHKNPLYHICIRPDAQRKTNNQSPVAPDVVDIVLHERNYWKRLEQLIKTTKFLVDALGNIESRQASLADCMLELIRCAKQMSQLKCDDDDDLGFWMHAKSVFNKRFHAINTDCHSLALFLHPMCRKLAITQAASGRSLEFMIKEALDVAKRWKWDKVKAMKLIEDMRAYNLSRAPFAGGQADGLAWWENLPISADTHPLKPFAVTILSIVPHAGDVERLFSDLGSTQSPRRCNLSVDTFETLGKIWANLRYHLHVRNVTAGKQTLRRHAHMHTRAAPGINLEVVKDLGDNFTWTPPLSALSEEDLALAGPESISLDDIDAEFAALEAQKEGEWLDSVDGKEVLEGNYYSFEELERVDKGIVPKVMEDEVAAVDHGARGDNAWDAGDLMSSSGLACP